MWLPVHHTRVSITCPPGLDNIPVYTKLSDPVSSVDIFNLTHVLFPLTANQRYFHDLCSSFADLDSIKLAWFISSEKYQENVKGILRHSD